MKVLLSNGKYYPAEGSGVINFVYWLALGLNRTSTDIFVAASSWDINNFEVEEDKWTQQTSGVVNYVKTERLGFPIELIKLVRTKLPDIDVYHANGLFYLLAPITVFFALKLKKRVVWSIHGNLDPNALKYNQFKKYFFLKIIKRLFASKVVFHSTCDKETELIKEKLGTSAQIVQIPIFMELPKKQNLKKENYLLFIGRIHPVKAIENLIEALAISDTFLNSDFILKIAGNPDNEYGRELKELTKSLNLTKKVEFIGMVRGDMKEEVLAKAYGMVMPSHTENFGIVVVEAMAQGTPVIASNSTPWQILEEEKAGFWVKNSKEKLKEAIDKIIEMDSSSYTNYSANAYELAKNRFDINANIGQWIDAYEKC